MKVEFLSARETTAESLNSQEITLPVQWSRRLGSSLRQDGLEVKMVEEPEVVQLIGVFRPERTDTGAGAGVDPGSQLHFLGNTTRSQNII